MRRGPEQCSVVTGAEITYVRMKGGETGLLVRKDGHAHDTNTHATYILCALWGQTSERGKSPDVGASLGTRRRGPGTL